MTDTDKIKAIQGLLGVDQDGTWGNLSQGALDALVRPTGTGNGQTEHHVKASSFADPADVAAFRRCKDQGKSDNDCFKLGDNAIGYWGDSTAENTGPSCALPPDDIRDRWGSVSLGRHKLVDVYKDDNESTETVTCVLKDTMPWKKNITNGAGIDLNPDAVRALGLEPPIMVSAVWRWV